MLLRKDTGALTMESRCSPLGTELQGPVIPWLHEDTLRKPYQCRFAAVRMIYRGYGPPTAELSSLYRLTNTVISLNITLCRPDIKIRVQLNMITYFQSVVINCKINNW